LSLVAELRTSSKLAISVAVSAATVGAIYGYDMSNIAGALLYLTPEFGLNADSQGLIATAVVIGEIVGALIGGGLSNRFGRKPVMVAVAAGFGLFSLLSGLAWGVMSLIVFRLLLGLTIGISVAVAPVYIAEQAPQKIRGSLLVMYQVATVIGVILGYLAAWALSSSGSWRVMLAAAVVPGAIITVALLRLPDTPRWLMMRGRVDEARSVLQRIDRNMDVEAEVADIREALSEEHGGGGIRDLFRKPYLRAGIFVVGLGFFVQATGINAIVYFSPRIFEAMGFTGSAATLGLPALVQVAALIAVFVSVSLVDKAGRRPILLIGIGIMVLANILLVVVFSIGTEFTGALTALGFIGLLLFTVGFTFGFGALVWVYAGESFPARLRSVGASAMLTANLTANAIVAAVFLRMLESLGGVGTFTVFGALAVAAFLFVFKLAPETKGRRLEDIRHYWENGGTWPEPSAAVERSAR
jgi:sugar porter (SP) family MFS transporter